MSISAFRHPMVRWSGIAGTFWVLFILLPSIPLFRTILATPLVVTENGALGDAAYVLSAGYAYMERLSAAADLYSMGRAPRIMLTLDDTRGPYSFSAKTNWTPTEWAIDFLKWRGVPEDMILIVPSGKESRFGTLEEARTIAKALPPDVTRLVIVTSAAHTRRSFLAFRRALPPEIAISPFAATTFRESAEMNDPLWQEYVKFCVYWFIA